MQVCVWRNSFTKRWKNAQTVGTWKELSQETELTVFFSTWWLHAEEHDTIFGVFRSALERCAARDKEKQEGQILKLIAHHLNPVCNWKVSTYLSVPVSIVSVEEKTRDEVNKHTLMYLSSANMQTWDQANVSSKLRAFSCMIFFRTLYNQLIVHLPVWLWIFFNLNLRMMAEAAPTSRTGNTINHSLLSEGKIGGKSTLTCSWQINVKPNNSLFSLTNYFNSNFLIVDSPSYNVHTVYCSRKLYMEVCKYFDYHRVYFLQYFISHWKVW